MKTLFALLVCLLTLQLKAQTNIGYYDKNGKITSDAKKATAYFIIKKLDGDSAWLYREFDMRDTIKMQGTYKDEMLKTPQGKFLYYFKQTKFPDYNTYKPGMDTNNYVKQTGYYLNGNKTGVWATYQKRGQKLYTETYVNGQLNGPYEGFNKLTGRLETEGNYENGLKTGDWCKVAEDSTVLEYYVYKKGKQLKGIYLK